MASLSCISVKDSRFKYMHVYLLYTIVIMYIVDRLGSSHINMHCIDNMAEYRGDIVLVWLYCCLKYLRLLKLHNH